MASAPQCSYIRDGAQCLRQTTRPSGLCFQHDPGHKSKKEEDRCQLLWTLGLLRQSFEGIYDFGTSDIAIEHIDNALKIARRL